MSRPEYSKPNFPHDAFEGTALYYSRYRIPYPQKLLDTLISQLELPRDGILVDLASGPGRVAIQLAQLFSKVKANDLDQEMVAVGKEEAKKQHVNNIEWSIGKAEDLNIEPNSIDLLTIGDAFHRLDQSHILDLSKLWLKPGGYIALIGMYSIWKRNEPLHKFVSEIVKKWTPDYSGQNISEYRQYGLLLEDKGFTDISSKSIEFQNNCTIDSIVGYLYSTSRCSKKVLGDRAAEFEIELRSELNKLSKQGTFLESVKCGYTLGKKPLS